MLAPICGRDKWQSQCPVLFWDMNSRAQRQRSFFDSLQTTQWLAKAELETYQRRQLANIVRHAATTTSFYKERLAPVLRKDGIPILKQSDLLDHQHEISSTDIPKNDGAVTVVSTSGSTGIPVQMKWTGLSRMMRRVARWRNYICMTWTSAGLVRSGERPMGPKARPKLPGAGTILQEKPAC